MSERPDAGKAAAPGRRRVRDPDAMRRRIIEAATAEFASHGYGGARVDRISTAAATVDRMLYYYFGSKEGVFQAVLEDAYERLGAAEQQLDLDQADPAQGMRALVAFTWNYYREHPEFIRLLNSENLHKGEHLRQSQRLQSLSFPLLSILARLLRRGAASGAFRKRLDPVTVYLTIASLAYFYLSNRYTLSSFLGADLMDDARQRRWLRHITDLVLAHIAAEPAARRKTATTRARSKPAQ